VQIIADAEDEVRRVEAANDVPAEVTNISTTEETIVLESAEGEKDEEDDDF
jgi:hypothetical protein